MTNEQQVQIEELSERIQGKVLAMVDSEMAEWVKWGRALHALHKMVENLNERVCTLEEQDDG